MPAEPDILLLCRCAHLAIEGIRKIENDICVELQTSAATSFVMGLRVLNLQRAVTAIGMFSLLESLLQERVGWDKPFNKLPDYLKNLGKAALADTFIDYKNAIYVLKHGRGRSYEALLKRQHELEFNVKLPEDVSFIEGRVDEVQILIDVNDDFVIRCAETIEEIAECVLNH